MIFTERLSARNPCLKATPRRHFNPALRLRYFCNRNGQARGPEAAGHIRDGDAGKTGAPSEL